MSNLVHYLLFIQHNLDFAVRFVCCVILFTEDCLIKTLTKINRMDIVHLIETQMNKSVQEQTSRTYAEIEKTLDHSEGRYASSNSTKQSI